MFSRFDSLVSKHGTPEFSPVQKEEEVKKIIKWCRTSLVIESRKVTYKSTEKVSKSFGNNSEMVLLRQDLLQLFLFLFEKEYAIKTPNLKVNTIVSQDKPILTPAQFLDMPLVEMIYTAIERDIENPSSLTDSQFYGLAIIWLILKERVQTKKQLFSLLTEHQYWYRINTYWFYDEPSRRIWISPACQMLLQKVWMDNSKFKPAYLNKWVNSYLTYASILPKYQNITFVKLRELAQIEYVLKCSPVEQRLYSGSLASAPLKQTTLYRILTGNKPKVEQDSSITKKSTERQSRAWKKSFGKASNPGNWKSIGEISTEKQLAKVKEYTKQLKAVSLAEANKEKKLILAKLRPILENPDSAIKTPWLWFILSWMYNLVSEGGVYNKRLRHKNTIRKYINTIAGPFLVEFSGSAPSKMTGFDWAIKFNNVVSTIQSPQSKANVGRFAQFMIDSGFTDDLSMTDLDIPGYKGKPDANLLTHSEAEKVVELIETQTKVAVSEPLICFYLGFYCGLRRNEIAGLQFKDIILGKDKILLQTRMNRFRELKSSTSSRNIPLSELMPDDAVEAIRYYLHKKKHKFTKQHSLIFQKGSIEDSFTLLTSILRHVTGDSSFRFHHLRHSCCQWSWYLLNWHRLVEPKSFRPLNHPYFCLERSNRLRKSLGISQVTRKRLWSLSYMLGHSNQETTIGSYFHTVDWQFRLVAGDIPPSDKLVRYVWGKRVSLDDNGYPILPLKLQSIWESIIPTQLDLPNALPKNLDLPDESSTVRMNNIPQSLSQTWEAIIGLAENYSAIEIAQQQHLPLSNIAKIETLEMHERHTYGGKKTDNMWQHVGYLSLSKSEHSFMNNFIRLYEKKQTESKNNPDNDFNSYISSSTFVDISKHLVPSKDNLPRLNDKKQVAFFLKFLHLLEIPEKDIQIKWYLSSPPQLDLEQSLLDRIREDLNWWQTLINKRVGYPELTMELIVSRDNQELTYELPNNFRYKVSNEGRFLAYGEKGTVSIHVQNRSKYLSKNERPIQCRSKAFTSFIRLLAIHYQYHESLRLT